MKLKCLIVDDEPMARASVKHLCEKHDSLEFIGACENAESALDFLSGNHVDILFLDVEMPGLDGIQFLKSLTKAPNIIITTSHKNYAFEAFEVKAIDFISKPIQYQRFKEAVQKVIDLENLKNNEASDEGFMYVKAEGKLTRVDYTDILYIESMRDYVNIRTKDGRLVVHSTLKKIHETLSNDGRFVRVHRSFICNINQVEDLLKNEVIIGDFSLPVSRTHKQDLIYSLKAKSA